VNRENGRAWVEEKRGEKCFGENLRWALQKLMSRYSKERNKAWRNSKRNNDKNKKKWGRND